jgi:hypothetical protein
MHVLRVVTVAICTLSLVASATDTEKHPQIAIEAPTVIAFFEPVTESQLANDPDTNDALDDFQFYARATRRSLEGSSVTFHEVYARELSLVVDGSKTIFTPEIPVGYYFAAPGRNGRVEYGVHTDEDILAIAEEFFAVKLRARHQKN